MLINLLLRTLWAALQKQTRCCELVAANCVSSHTKERTRCCELVAANCVSSRHFCRSRSSRLQIKLLATTKPMSLRTMWAALQKNEHVAANCVSSLLFCRSQSSRLQNIRVRYYKCFIYATAIYKFSEPRIKRKRQQIEKIWCLFRPRETCSSYKMSNGSRRAFYGEENLLWQRAFI